jgi:hypothetical protein
MDVNSRDPLQNIIPFRIKGVEIGRFDSSGNLKIGTTTTTAPTVRLDISGGEARVNSGSAASTAITTVGRIGVNTAAPTADLDVSGVSRMTASTATATALTTTGRIGVNMLTPTTDLDVSGVSRLTASSATATALTTTGRIGVNTAAPTVDLDVSGVSRLTASTAASTALTTTGRIGINVAAPTTDLDVSGVSRLTASSATATALTTTGRIGVNTATPTVDLDVLGVANVSNYLSVGSGSSSGVTTTSNIPDKFFVRTGGSNWRDFIPLLVANSTTNIIIWGLDSQWYIIGGNEIAQQYSYFAAYWLNANRAVVGTQFTVESFAGSPPATRGIFTFTATAVSNGIVTAYTGFLSQGSFGTQPLTPQQDGIDAGVARRSLSNRTILMGGSVETVYLGVSGNANVTGSMTINSCTPRSSVTYTGTVLRTNYSIPAALRGGDFITNKVYFSIRVLAGPRSLFLKPNGSATTFHSFIQQTGGGTVALSGVDDTAGFRMCEIMGSMYGSGYTAPSFTHIVGEFTIIRNTVGNTSSISSGTGITTRIYGTLVQYGNHYMQKGDFQGQASNGGSNDSYDRIDLFQFLTSDANKDADTGNSVAVTIEG